MKPRKPGQRRPEKHPEEWRRDLNPDLEARPFEAEEELPSAYDVKAAHRRLSHLSDDTLKQIRILPEGSRLTPGATYLDLCAPWRGEITAGGDLYAVPGSLYVPKRGTPYWIWNILRGIEDFERVDHDLSPEG